MTFVRLTALVQAYDLTVMGRACPKADRSNGQLRRCPDGECEWFKQESQWTCDDCRRAKQLAEQARRNPPARRREQSPQVGETASQLQPTPRPARFEPQDALRRPDPRTESVGAYVRLCVAQGFSDAMAREVYCAVWRTDCPELVNPPTDPGDIPQRSDVDKQGSRK